MNAKDQSPLLLTIGETATQLRLSPSSVRRRIAAGEIRPVRLGTGPCAPVRVELVELFRVIRRGSPAGAPGTASPEAAVEAQAASSGESR